MTRHELISVNSDLLRKLHDNGIKPSDYQYLQLYERYLAMVASGEKVTYIVATLSALYEVTERTVYRLIDFFSTTALI